jgi:diacylglycerol kinase (ATP)
MSSATDSVIVLLNTKCGGRKSKYLLTQICELIHPSRIVELGQEDSIQKLRSALKKIKNPRLVVCGGDGTVNWALTILESMRLKVMPPVAILPFGTANDMSRVLRWGSIITGFNIPKFFGQVARARVVNVDRWKISIVPIHATDGKYSQIKELRMNNYFSIGVDSQIAYEFHQFRERLPPRFFNKIFNYSVYGAIGAKTAVVRPHAVTNLWQNVHLEIDGHKVELPHIQTLVLTNIPSYIAGQNIWGKQKNEEGEEIMPQNACDGLLEASSLRNVFHLGALKAYMSNGIRLGQGKKFKIIVDTMLPIQVDGEPFLITEPSVLYITHLMQTPLLYNIDRDRRGKHFKSLTGFNLKEIQKMEATNNTAKEEVGKSPNSKAMSTEEKSNPSEGNPDAVQASKPKSLLSSWQLFSKL